MNNPLRFFVIKFSMAFLDLILIAISFLIATFLVKQIFGGLHAFILEAQFNEKLVTHLLLSLFCVAWYWIRLRHYSYRKPFWFELKEILRTLLIFAIIDLAINAFSKWHFSRYIWVFTWAFAFLLVPLGRSLLRNFLDRIGLWKRDTVIIGCGKNAIDAYLAINSEKNLGFKVTHFIDSCSSSHQEIFGCPVIKTDIYSLNKIEDKSVQFIIALESDQSDLRDTWMRNLAKNRFRNVSVIPTIRGLPLYGTDMAFIFSHEVMIFRVNNNLAKRTSQFRKRMFDIFGSLAILSVTSPLFLYLYWQVKKDGGPAIFGHERIGRNGSKFKCLKFRSMVMNSQEVLKEILESDSESRAEWERDFKLKNDPRITKIGHFIRKTSLDELPQLFNVLTGSMSLVGPRPVVIEELKRYQDSVEYYLMAKPGMTGLWQVSGRNDIDYETRVYFDAWYVKNWSMWNDIAILFKTINVVFKRDGAY
ncbi:undecaprenyl-phosphate galactose phosphotransferase WbaP [Buttiauxella noackiae]|uniref:undecaprenyl-phosphate galactose phosphotransferase WbaP n=1 Tax=Buttiauxella noackiae TaxID=82992 RepID=UPI000AF59E1B|nr:undecaprenyl-phosphate galactose phosphotransferase WbaP [Buttiauxella noackiae]